LEKKVEGKGYQGPGKVKKKIRYVGRDVTTRAGKPLPNAGRLSHERGTIGGKVKKKGFPKMVKKN